MNATFQFLHCSVPFVYDGRDRMVLPQDFTPGPDVVIIGRGTKVHRHPANQKYRALIASQLRAYSDAPTKGLKSRILWLVLNEVRGYSTCRLGFVKRDNETGRWFAIEDNIAKMNISQAFRDGLHLDYKSSKKCKQVRRKREIEAQLGKFNTSVGCSTAPVPYFSMNNIVMANAASNCSHLYHGVAMNSLRSFLATPCNSPVLADFGNQINLDLQQNTTDSSQTFARLYYKFGAHIEASTDPFEPEPIAPQKPAVVDQGFIFGFPDFPMSAMDSTMEIPELHAGNGGPYQACLKEPIFPSMLQLTAWEQNEDGSSTKSISSLSTISDYDLLQDDWFLMDSDLSRNSLHRLPQVS